ncbi:FR47-like [Trinorchestia longiramus]|nr:FR47-like [Trinorchestia longiramus]
MSSQESALTMVAVPPEEYESFADGLRNYLPDSYQIEFMLRLYCKYRHLTVLNSTLYAPSDRNLRYKMAVITPVCALKKIRTISIFWSDCHVSKDAVFYLLRSLPITSWQLPCTIRQMPFHLQPTMHKIIHKLSGGVLNHVTPIPTVVLSLAPADTLPIPQLPEGYYFKKLDGTFAEETLRYWSPSYTETKESMSFFLETLPSAGIFYRNKSGEEMKKNLGPILKEFSEQDECTWRINGENATNNSGLIEESTFEELGHRAREVRHLRDELASFVVLKHGSDTGMTFTHEKHRRKGLGRAVTLYLAHELHSKGIPVIVHVVVDYEMSINMHKQMGFKYMTHSCFPVYCPKNFDFESVPRLPLFIKTFSSTPDKWFDISGEE